MVGGFTKTPLTSSHTSNLTMNIRSHSIEVLVVEDNQGDIDLIKEVFADSQFPINLHIVEDGMRAIAYLRQVDEYASACVPHLILLDLNLPCKGGLEVLKDIKTDNNLKHIPVMVLTTSDSQQDICQAYYLGANCYIKKPLGLEEFIKAIRAIEYYWFTIVKLPTQKD